MHKANELFGKEIIAGTTGEKKATVSDLVFDPETRGKNSRPPAASRTRETRACG